MAPSAGTPLNAFDLVSKIIGVFEPDENDVVDEFRRLEQKYFGPVSPDADYIPVNFQLNLFPEKAESDDQLSILPIPILDELNINCYYAANENDYPDSDSIASHVSLEAGKNIYTFRITTPANTSHGNERSVINKVRICFSDKPGLINFYSLQVKDNTGSVLTTSQPYGEAPMRVSDIIPIHPDNGKHATFLMFAGQPTIEVNFKDYALAEENAYLDVVVEIGKVDSAEQAELRQSLSALLSVNSFVADNAAANESARNQLAMISQQLSRNGRADLESRLAGMQGMIDDLESTVSEQASTISALNKNSTASHSSDEENARLRKTIQWYQDTYEKRSFAGVVITKFRDSLKKVYLRLLGFLISLGFVQNRYAVKY
ncbi:MAG: hypothetical protein EOO00_11005, partial [Chitinophagaceae bacterium]